MCKIEHTLPFNTILSQNNLAKALDPEDLMRVGQYVSEGYERDLQSRSEWELMHGEVLKTALQLDEKKDFPWEGAAHVQFPLTPIAALMFQARAYPILVPESDLVRCMPDDAPLKNLEPQMRKEQKDLAERIGRHMSKQILGPGTWQLDQDRLLMIIALVGCAFKKVYYDPKEDKIKSILVLPNDLVVNYFTRDINKAEFVSHRLRGVSKNDVVSRLRLGIYHGAEEDIGQPQLRLDKLDTVRDKEQGLTPGSNTGDCAPLEMIETLCLLDLDGDYYSEPYVVTFDRGTGRVYRITRNFHEDGIEYTPGKPDQVACIVPPKVYSKYYLMPSPDGGFYEMGFGTLLRHPNKIVNTLFNQLLDAGSAYNMGGGFLARTIKVRGGEFRFRPGEFKRTDSSPADLKDGIMPLPVHEPSSVLFQLLTMLVEYCERLTGATDVMMGVNPGQNTPAETSRNTMEQGLKIFSGIIARVYFAMAEEFRMWFDLNARFYAGGSGKEVQAIDYQNAKAANIFPSADAAVVSDAARVQQAMAVYQLSGTTPPGVFDKYEVLKMVLKALRVRDIEGIAPDPKGPNAIPPMPTPEVIKEQMQVQERREASQNKLKAKLADLSIKAQKMPAEIAKLEAETAKLKAEAHVEGVNAAANLANTQLGYMKEQHEQQMSTIQFIQEMLEKENAASTADQPGGMGGMVGGPGGQGVPAGTGQPGAAPAR